MDHLGYGETDGKLGKTDGKTYGKVGEKVRDRWKKTIEKRSNTYGRLGRALSLKDTTPKSV